MQLSGLGITQPLGSNIRPRKDEVAALNRLLKAQSLARIGKCSEMLRPEMLVKCRSVAIDLVENDAVALAFGLQNVKLQASGLAPYRSFCICVDEAAEFRSRTLFDVKFDNDCKKHEHRLCTPLLFLLLCGIFLSSGFIAPCCRKCRIRASITKPASLRTRIANAVRPAQFAVGHIQVM